MTNQIFEIHRGRRRGSMWGNKFARSYIDMDKTKVSHWHFPALLFARLTSRENSHKMPRSEDLRILAEEDIRKRAHSRNVEGGELKDDDVSAWKIFLCSRESVGEFARAYFNAIKDDCPAKLSALYKLTREKECAAKSAFFYIMFGTWANEGSDIRIADNLAVCLRHFSSIYIRESSRDVPESPIF